MKARVLATGLVAAAALAIAVTAPASALVKAFPSGCWIGSKAYSGAYKGGPLKANVTKGTLTFVLWVGKGATGPERSAFGFMKLTGNGSGTLTIGGSQLALQVKIRGNYTLSGSASHVVANGSYRYVGVAKGTGQFVPIAPVEFKVPLEDVPLTIQTVAHARVSGVLLKAPWTAVRRSGTAAKGPAACANAAK